MCDRSAIAILLAGGVGSRLDLNNDEKRNISKAWLKNKAESTTMLELNIIELLKVKEIKNIYIIFDVNNELEFYKKAGLFEKLINNGITVEKMSCNAGNMPHGSNIITYLRRYPTYESTLGILREMVDLLDLCESEKIFFVFGHAPRPANHFVDLLEEYTLHTQIVATVVHKTSKKLPVYIRNNEVQAGQDKGSSPIEPPYILTLKTLKKYKALTWLDFISKAHEDKILHLIPIDAPGEFNYYSEYLLYLEYIDRVFLA